jgi:hypothetical protein
MGLSSAILVSSAQRLNPRREGLGVIDSEQDAVRMREVEPSLRTVSQKERRENETNIQYTVECMRSES